MSADNQTLIPESFSELFKDARGRLTVPLPHLIQLSEFCEDMSQMLVETCRTIHFRDGVDESTVLRKVHDGLLLQPQQFTPDTAWWVIRRTAELLQWPCSLERPLPAP